MQCLDKNEENIKIRKSGVKQHSGSPSVKMTHSESCIQTKKCLELAKLLIKADQMVKKRICRKRVITTKK